MRFILVSLLSILLLNSNGSAQQQDSISQSSINSNRLMWVGITSGALYVSSMTALYSVWYADFRDTPFHTFDDNDEWLLLDKAGHTFTAYNLSAGGMDVLKWVGLSDRKAMWYSTSASMLFLSTIEVFDGFSDGWGFSIGDIAANSIGSGLMISQEYLWQEQRITLKLSYSESKYPKYRPELLGYNTQESLLKDYNGQTYWLSANIHSIASLNQEGNFPKWLNLAVGYGGDGMLGGDNNPDRNDKGDIIPRFNRKRQLYFAPDIDLRRIKVNSRFLKTTFKALSFIKIPAPTLEWSEGGVFKIRPLFF